MSYLENDKNLSNHIWRKDSQLLRQPPTTVRNFEEKNLNLSFLKFFLKKSQHTSYLENYKDLNSNIW